MQERHITKLLGICDVEGPIDEEGKLGPFEWDPATSNRHTMEDRQARTGKVVWRSEADVILTFEYLRDRLTRITAPYAHQLYDPSKNLSGWIAMRHTIFCYSMHTMDVTLPVSLTAYFDKTPDDTPPSEIVLKKSLRRNSAPAVFVNQVKFECIDRFTCYDDGHVSMPNLFYGPHGGAILFSEMIVAADNLRQRAIIRLLLALQRKDTPAYRFTQHVLYDRNLLRSIMNAL